MAKSADSTDGLELVAGCAARGAPARRRGVIRGGLFVAGLLAVACAATGRAETLTIATYNVENYGSANRMTAGGFRPDYPKPEDEKQALRQVIVALHADVLVLQEIGPRPYLDELQRDLRADGCDYSRAVLAEAGDAERHVALLSKRSLEDVRTESTLEFSYGGTTERVKRGLLEATIRTASGPLTIFALHLKSRYSDRPEDPLCELRRAGEATAIRNAVLKRFPDPAAARFVILGDCNDTKVSRAMQRLLRRGDVVIATLLTATDSRREAWTYRYAREDSYARFDHILVSPGLNPAVEGGAARIYDGPGVDGASDHRPVLVRLSL